MTGYLRIKSPWAQLGLVLLVFSPQFILLLVSLFITPTDLKPNLTDPSVVAAMKWAQAFSTLAFFLLPAFLYAVFTFRGKYFYFLGFKKPQRTNMYLIGIVCMLAAFPFVFWLGDLNQRIPLPDSLIRLEKETGHQMEAFLKVNSPFDLLINLIVVALLPAICEEMFFRGALQRVLIHLTKNPWAGIIIGAILFSALHMQFLGFLPRMFLGIILGALYWYSGSLWTSIIAHFVTNGVQVVAVSVSPKFINDNPSLPIYLAILSGIITFALLFLYQRQSTITWAKVYDHESLNKFNQFIV